MRVTYNISTNQYLRNNNRLNSNMLTSMNRIMTQRRFNRVSEDSINGVKALSIRRQLRNVAIYNDNLNAAKELFNSAEQSLLTMSDKIYIQMESELVAASNGTYEQMDLDIYAQSFNQMAEEMVKTLNADFAERQIFGGTSNGVAPFSIEQALIRNSDGDIVYPPDWEKYYEINGDEVSLKEGITLDDIPKSVLYNKVPINFGVLGEEGKKITEGTYSVSIIKLDENGLPNCNDEDAFEFELTQETINTARVKNDNSLIFPGSKPIYIDIGIGIKYDDNGTVDPQTALDIALNGASITGSGIDDDGYSMNLIQLALDTAYNLTRGINAEVEMDLDKANEAIALLAEKTEDGAELSSEDYDKISKMLQESKSGLVLLQDDNGNYVVQHNKQVVYNSAEGPHSGVDEFVTKIDREPGDDSGYLKLATWDGREIKVNKYLGDQSFVNAVIDRAANANNHILKQITTLGIKQNTIDFYVDRMEDTEFNLKERQNLVEGTDMESEIMNFFALMAAYQASSKMGSYVLPHSIFDFI